MNKRVKNEQEKKTRKETVKKVDRKRKTGKKRNR